MAADIVTLRTAVEERDIELAVRVAEERAVIDLNRERVKRALVYIVGGYENPTYLDAARNEVGAIGESLNRRRRQIGGDAA